MLTVSISFQIVFRDIESVTWDHRGNIFTIGMGKHYYRERSLCRARWETFIISPSAHLVCLSTKISPGICQELCYNNNFFETGSHRSQDGLELSVQMDEMTLNSCPLVYAFQCWDYSTHK